MKEDLFWLTSTEVSVCLGKETISKQPKKIVVRGRREEKRGREKKKRKEERV